MSAKVSIYNMTSFQKSYNQVLDEKVKRLIKKCYPNIFPLQFLLSIHFIERNSNKR